MIEREREWVEEGSQSGGIGKKGVKDEEKEEEG